MPTTSSPSRIRVDQVAAIPSQPSMASEMNMAPANEVKTIKPQFKKNPNITAQIKPPTSNASQYHSE